MQLETHQLINEHMCKLKSKSMMYQYMTNKPVMYGLIFMYPCGSRYSYKLHIYLGMKMFGLGASVVILVCESLEDTSCYAYFDNSFASLMTQLLGSSIYGKGTVRQNRKQIPSM